MIANLLMLIGSASAPGAIGAADVWPAVARSAAPAAAETEAASRTVGPFGSYAAAADYACYLEEEYRYCTRVIRSGRWYYVMYWR